MTKKTSATESAPEGAKVRKGMSFKNILNLRIGGRITGGFALILALLLTVAGAAYFGLTNVESGFEEYARVSSNTLRVQDIDRNVVGLRRNVLVYKTSGDEAVLKRVSELEATLRADLTTAIEGTKSEERRANFVEMQSTLDSYMAGVGSLSEMERMIANLTNEQMTPLGRQIYDIMEGIANEAFAAQDFEAAAYVSAVQEAFGRARLRAEQFLTTVSQERADQAKAEFEESTSQLEQLPGHLINPTWRAKSKELIDLAAKYVSAFTTLETTIFDQDKLFSVAMDETAKKFAETAKMVKESQIARMTEIDESMADTIATSLSVTLAIAASAFAIGVFFAWFLGRGIVRPLSSLNSVMQILAGGDKTIAVTGMERSDEVGDMARTVEVFKQNAIRMDEMTAEQAEQEKRAAEEKKVAMNKLADDFESQVKAIVDTLSSSATEMESTAQTMSASAEQTGQQASAVAAASEEASTNVRTVSAAAEELSSSVSEISRQVSQSTQIASKAVSDAERTNETVRSLVEAAQRIGDVVNLINEIAEQTNLLALNATIEAARAGEAGKGFAVVASEVKSLATQTGKATEEISAQIAAMQSSTQGTVQAIDGIRTVIGEISEIATTIASAVEEQGAATQEISRNVGQAAQGTQEVSTNITGVSQAAGETGAAAGQVLTAAQELSRQSALLRTEMDRFVDQVRAA